MIFRPPLNFCQVLLYMKKVLVLCQRKSGWLYAGKIDNEDIYKKVENIITPKINQLVRSLVGDDYAINYLSSVEDKNSDLATGKVGIEGILKNDTFLTFNNETIPVSDFIHQHEGSYDLILLNTCPFILMDYNLISQLLAADGLMVFTVYTASGKKGNARRMIDIPSKYFTLADTHGDDVLIYTKTKGGARKRMTKRKRMTRRKRMTKR